VVSAHECAHNASGLLVALARIGGPDAERAVAEYRARQK
jgi:hypothetical protein